jgi:hypothetical protein
MIRPETSYKRVLRRILQEPVVHFFALGALLLLVHRMFVGSPNTITVTPGLEAELNRRFADLNGRAPDAHERKQALDQWQHDEALFRQALREHLDRDDPAIRAALIDKMHARAGLEVPEREPTDAELSAWLEAHRDQYQTPLRYDFEFFAFAIADPASANQLSKTQRALAAGGHVATMGRPLLGANLTLADMNDRIDPELAQRIPTLPQGGWVTVAGKQDLFLARVKKVDGGLPDMAELRPRLVSDWSVATRQDAIERVLQRTIERYRFEQRR